MTHTHLAIMKPEGVVERRIPGIISLEKAFDIAAQLGGELVGMTYVEGF